MWHIFASCIGSASMGNVAQPYMGYGTLEHPAALTSGREPGGAPGRRRRTACPRRTRRTRAPASRSAAPWPGTSGRRARRTSRRPARPPARRAPRSRPAHAALAPTHPAATGTRLGLRGRGAAQTGAASRTCGMRVRGSWRLRLPWLPLFGLSWRAQLSSARAARMASLKQGFADAIIRTLRAST